MTLCDQRQVAINSFITQADISLFNFKVDDNVPEDDIDLRNILTKIDHEDNADSDDSDISDTEQESAILDQSNNNIHDSFANVSISDNYPGTSNTSTMLDHSDDPLQISQTSEDEDVDLIHILDSFGFSKFNVPPMLCRHPPPAVGKDDDISKIREILDDVLVKLGYTNEDVKTANRILCGPDNKIGKCVIELMKTDEKYRIFLPEFPLLHLRKSKITILFSAYQDAGLIQLTKFMKDDGEDDWRKLVSVQHIDMAQCSFSPFWEWGRGPCNWEKLRAKCPNWEKVAA